MYSKENMELKMNMNKTISMEKLNELNKDFQKTKNQLNAMNNLGRKYQEQIDKIYLEHPELKNMFENEQNQSSEKNTD